MVAMGLISMELGRMQPAQLREQIRSGKFSGPTAGLALGYSQANLVILPEALAADFRTFCDRNPGPCPLIEVTQPGVFEPRCAPGGDLRTDLPRYRCYRQGELVDRPTEVLSWLEEAAPGNGGQSGSRAVCFLLGCSFTFEAALIRAGIPVRHIELGCNVPMYRTSIRCQSAGPFAGPMVVSMRPMTQEQAERARQITLKLPQSHGAPIHLGEPADIGIADIGRPDYGDPVEIRPGEVPVFWACGVTPLEAILSGRPAWAVVHEPGHMFVTDIKC